MQWAESHDWLVITSEWQIWSFNDAIMEWSLVAHNSENTGSRPIYLNWSGDSTYHILTETGEYWWLRFDPYMWVNYSNSAGHTGVFTDIHWREGTNYFFCLTDTGEVWEFQRGALTWTHLITFPEDSVGVRNSSWSALKSSFE